MSDISDNINKTKGPFMQFISVRDLRGKSSDVWRQLKSEREMVVTSNGKPVAILSAVSEATLEETLMAIRRATAVSAVTSMQQQSVRNGLDKTPLKKVNEVINDVRRGNS
jgi:antitoxin (DNA-binding transcriptional repressor) of toxin-antitoxin stability system